MKIGIIGCGNMGAALIGRLSAAMGKDALLMASDRDAKRREQIRSKYGVAATSDNGAVAGRSDIVIVAVKPKDIDAVLTEIAGAFSKDKLLISIAAGISTKHVERIVGKSVPVIRVMPNMPAVIGEAISTLSRGSAARESHAAMAEEIFSLLGDVEEIDEKLVDAVTAISGSGPAYFFCLMESLIKTAKSLGLEGAIARRLVLKTALGSVKLLYHLKEDPPALRAKVASKGGTTEAALEVFESRKFHDVIRDAVTAARKRSRALSGKGRR
jgi:pyrroline-5-carboxylate reductase